jgi:hypothetical protein
MNNFDFYSIVLNNIVLSSFFLIFSLIVHFLIFRPLVNSVVDPYFLSILSSIFSTSVVLILAYTRNISMQLFLSFVLTQLGFFIGLFTFRFRKEPNVSIRVNFKQNYNSHLIAFYFFSFIYLLSQGVIYVIKGIPLFMESRLETFTGGGGSGVFGRISDVSSVFSLYAFFLVVKIDRFRLVDGFKYLTLVLIFITLFLSGSKSSFLIVLYVFWCFIFFARVKGDNVSVYYQFFKKNIKIIILGGLGLVSVIISIQSNSNGLDEIGLNPIIALILRFIHSGDVYWYAYPNNVYLLVNGERWFAALFTDTLGLLRLIEWDQLPEAIGITLKNIHHSSDILQGPNARHNVFGLIYFGLYGSILFSFILGALLSFIRNVLPYLVNNNYFGGGIFTFLMCKGAALDTDPMLAITYFNNLIFIFPVLYVGYLFVRQILLKNSVVK